MLSNCEAGEDSWESTGCNEIKPLNPKENQPWIFIRRTDAETEAPILWPSHMKSWLTRKDPDAGKDWRQEEKRVAKDEVVGWHHGLNGHETEQTRGDTERLGGLACCSPWGCKESDTTWRLNNSVKYAKTIISCVSIVVGPQNEKQNHQKNKKDKKEQNALSLFNLLKYLPPFACHQSQGWLYRGNSTWLPFSQWVPQYSKTSWGKKRKKKKKKKKAWVSLTRERSKQNRELRTWTHAKNPTNFTTPRSWPWNMLSAYTHTTVGTGNVF